jgi:hypothetical protein
MHDHLWSGADLKLRDARNTLDEMREVLRPSNSGRNAALESTGMVASGPVWQTKFFQLVGRFVAEVRAVTSIIEASFGEDRGHPDMKAWWPTLSIGEQPRPSLISLAVAWPAGA